MKVLMIGAGVIGTIYGYVLAEAGNDITHYVRPGKIHQFENGISLSLLDGRTRKPRQIETVYCPELVEVIDPARNYELIIVSVRHYQIEQILPLLAGKIGPANILFFNTLWEKPDFIDAYLPGDSYLWGFPVAGGGYTAEGKLEGALLEDVRLGELDGRATPRLEQVARMFQEAGIKPDVRSSADNNIVHWLWWHFAMNGALIGAAIKAGSAEKLLKSINASREAILAVREGMKICEARGVNIPAFDDAKMFNYPSWLAAAAVGLFYSTNKPARSILTLHTGIEEISRIYYDLLQTGQTLGIATPHLETFKPYVDNQVRQEAELHLTR